MSSQVPTHGRGAVPTVGRLLLTQDDLITEADPAFCTLFGFMSHALVGIRFDSLLTKASQIMFQIQFSPSLRLNGKAEGFRFSLKSGKAEDVNIIVSARATLEESKASYELLLSPEGEDSDLALRLHNESFRDS
ncbi:hypothetical protein [Cohnella hashimotonis]|uniref:PAS domain-containing protein n=1 Tax=Cohnella hashimotonis TaxID=2826895 RepID=A0ABT6TMM8_9BACL|nr:hypothetical protein [Cohnella hashimotonis]MDI4647528.1 hypothetical protein [Cohnella hashimotonis]